MSDDDYGSSSYDCGGGGGSSSNDYGGSSSYSADYGSSSSSHTHHHSTDYSSSYHSAPTDYGSSNHNHHSPPASTYHHYSPPTDCGSSYNHHHQHHSTPADDDNSCTKHDDRTDQVCRVTVDDDGVDTDASNSRSGFRRINALSPPPRRPATSAVPRYEPYALKPTQPQPPADWTWPKKGDVIKVFNGSTVFCAPRARGVYIRGLIKSDQRVWCRISPWFRSVTTHDILEVAKQVNATVTVHSTLADKRQCHRSINTRKLHQTWPSGCYMFTEQHIY